MKQLSDCCNAEVATANSGLVGETNYYICTKCHNDCDVIAKPKELDWMKPRGKNSRFQRIWTNMNTRCYCQKSDNYKNYGGRGIGIDWKTFKDFYEDMYPSWLIHLEQFGKKDTTIDRKDVNGNYSKENCKWSTIKEQYTNRRDTHMISTYRVSQGLGVVMTSFKRWVKKYGVDVAVKNIVDEKLAQQRTELLEEIKMFPLLIRKEPESKGYNLAVKEINNKITNLLNKKDE